MRNRTFFLIVALIVVGLLALGGTVGTMALTHSGFMGYGYGNGMMGRTTPGYQRMMNGNQPYHGTMMGGYPQSPARQGTPSTSSTHVNMDIVVINRFAKKIGLRFHNQTRLYQQTAW